MKKLIKKRAFTVVELLVVLGIVGVLIVALMVGVSNKDVVKNTASNIDNVIVDEGNNQDNNILNLADHTHTYNRKKESDQYLKSAATCSKEAVYYYSCSCGASATGKTFKGDKAPHDYSAPIIEDEYLASPASCVFGATYYYTCTMCGIKGTELFPYGTPDTDNHIGQQTVKYQFKNSNVHVKYTICDACNLTVTTIEEDHIYENGRCTKCDQHTHSYDQRNPDNAYLKTSGTCSTAPTYFYSCKCGAVGTSYFSYGTPVPHVYIEGPTTSAYFKEAANCGSGAVYYKSCMYCGIKWHDTFTSGEKDYTNHVGGTTIVYDKYDDSTHIARTVCVTCSTVFGKTTEAHRLGADRTCKDCFTHVHSFVYRRAEVAAMKSEATCFSPAVYYVTCACGEGGTETFTDGSTVPHDYANVENNAFLISTGTCTKKAEYYKSCRFGCGRRIDETFLADKFDTSNHTGNLLAGGTKDAHLLWTCCNRIADPVHIYTSSAVVEAATCSYWGSTKFTCECGYSFVDQNIPFDPNNHVGTVIMGDGSTSAHKQYSCCGLSVDETHKYDKEVVDEKYFAEYATCAYGDLYYKSCECGYTDKSLTFDVGDKNPQYHVSTLVPGGEKDSHAKCAGCGITREDGSQHKYTIHSAATATCIQQGLNTYVCDCGYSYETTELSLNPNRHVGNIVAVGTENEHAKCDACNRVVQDGSYHVFTESVDKAPTCVNMGTTRYTCSCGFGYTEDNIPQLGHAPASRPTFNEDHSVATVICTHSGCEQSWFEETEEKTVRQATCVTTRQYNHSVRLNVNGEWKTFSCNTIHEGSTLGHDPQLVPTWNSDHTIATILCSRDGCNTKWSGPATEKVTSVATCISPLVYNHTTTFEVNGVEKTYGCGSTHSEPALGHIFSAEATCTTAQECLREGCNLVTSNPLGHKLSDPQWNTDHTKLTVTCLRSNCGETWTGTPLKEFYVAPSCTVAEEYTHTITLVINGVDKVYECGQHHTGAPLGHSPSATAIWTGSNCKTAAVKCTRDGCSAIWSGRSAETTTINATCTVMRVYNHKATFNVNGESKTYYCNQNHTGSTLGHTYTSTPSYSWGTNCVQCTAQVECSRSGCNYVLTETQDGIKNIMTEATCSTNGKFDYYVVFNNSMFEQQRCPHTHQSSALGHSYTQKTVTTQFYAAAANCETPTLYYYNCSHGNCTATSTNTFGVGDALGHTFTLDDRDSKYLKQAATCTTDAIYYYRCSRASCTRRSTDTYTDVGSALGHNYKDNTSHTYLASAATCFEPNYYYYKCTRCSDHNDQTYANGSPNKHIFMKQDPSATYLYAAANCDYGTRYYLRCNQPGCTWSTKDDGSCATWEVDNKLGHTFNRDSATCGIAKVCSRCQYEAEPAKDHSFAGTSTCTKGEACVICGFEKGALGCNSDGNPANHYCTSIGHADGFLQILGMLLSGGSPTSHHVQEYCIRCNETQKDTWEGHTYEWINDENLLTQLAGQWCKYCYTMLNTGTY